MPEVRTLMLMKCVGSPQRANDGKFWLVETYLTSDGPRMRVIPTGGMTETAAREELNRRQDLIRAPEVVPLAECRKANRAAYDQGRRDGFADADSRSRSSPGNGDMGG